MIEKLFALDLPPGFANNGTTYQSKNRWFKGNLVRFFQKNKQPIGGWVQRTLTGATITGTPTAMHSWTDNSTNNWLAIGTTSKLYVVSAANVVYDITPATGQLELWQWHLGNMGSYLIASYSREPSGTIPNLFVWKGVVGVAAVDIFDQGGGLANVYGFVVTPERFLVALRGVSPDASTLFASPIVENRPA